MTYPGGNQFWKWINIVVTKEIENKPTHAAYVADDNTHLLYF